MLWFTLIVVLSSSSSRSIFRPPFKPNIKIKPEKVLKIGKNVVKHAPKVLEVADLAVGLATAKVNNEGWVVWKDLKKILVPDMKTLTDKILSYGSKFEDLYNSLHTLDTSLHSETLMRTNLTNAVAKVQKSMKRANSAALKTWTGMKMLKGMSIKNEVLGGVGAAGSSFLLCFVLVISYCKYKAKQEVRKAKKIRKMASAMVRNCMSDQQHQNDRFQDVTDELQAQAHPLQGGLHQEASAQQNYSSSWLARIF